MSQILLDVRNIKKLFPVKENGLFHEQKYVHAVDDVSFAIREGETLGLVGESGCGKSTTGRVILNLIRPDSGDVLFEGESIYHHGARERNDLRKKMQLVFQDPFASLNPKKKIHEIVEEPLRFHGFTSKHERKELAEEMLSMVGVDLQMGQRYPHELSGGQQQRVGIARALVLKPKFVVCDEAVSALDVSIRAQVLNLLERLKDELNLSYLFISHDLSVVRHVSDRVCVMYLGKVVEMADYKEIFEHPAHPYTASLIQSIPIPDPSYKRKRMLLPGDIPSPVNPPPGCRFRSRCYMADNECDGAEPSLEEIGKDHYVACVKCKNRSVVNS
ncbi:ABC transporter ATP-binding protein [Bacteroidia bacterium]|nr:ABC transporter ATP-binding protein [Bacteroidia bacterium]